MNNRAFDSRAVANARTVTLGVAALLISTSFSVSAEQSTPAAATPNPCATAMSTLQIVSCTSAKQRLADGRMAKALATVLSAMPPDRRQKLRASQALWERFRTADCQTYFGSGTGTIAGVEAAGCMVDRAEDRIKELMALGEPEGN